ncbi:MAG: hypothetical protein QG565_988 [Campylobacterota bacterium]|nr:hypothetical protein [Campylobacterota bacterium]
MNTIEQKAFNTYQDNLKYFEQFHPYLIEKINILSSAIQNGSYKENYALEYKDAYFDVLNTNTGNYLYTQNSVEYANTLVKEVNFKKSHNTINGFDSFLKVNDEDLKPQNSINTPLFATANIIHYTQQATSKDNEMEFITKYIFCGIGLGLHLQPIQNKTKATMLFLYEDNLELFRLSLFVTNYQELASKSELFFAIADDKRELQVHFEQFYIKGFNNNHYLKYSLFPKTDDEKIKQIKSLILTNEHLAYPYSKRLKFFLKAPEYLIEGYPFLNFSSMYNNSPLTNRPVLVIASGPSLDRNALWLQKNRDKFFIISVLSSIKKLYNLGIEPDIFAHIDEMSLSVNIFDGLDIQNSYKNTIFILGSGVSRNVVEKLKKENIFFLDNKGGYKRDFGLIEAASIGEVVYAISLILGANNIYLLGLDLALDPETNRSHSAEHIFSKIISLDDNVHDMTLHESAIKTKGNFLQTVYTTPVFMISIIMLEAISNKYLTHGQKVYNLSNGAYLKGTIPLEVERLDAYAFEETNQKERFASIKSFLSKISQSGLNKKDREFLISEINGAKEIKEYILKFKTASQKDTYESYMKNFNTLFLGIANNESVIIKNIMYSYFIYSSSYIFDLFNTKDLANSKRHLKKIDEIFTNELIKLVDIYIKAMEVYKEWEEKNKASF